MRVEEVRELHARGACAGGDRDAREEGGSGDADVGFGADQVTFARGDVGTLEEHFGGKAGGEDGRLRDAGGETRREQILGDGGAAEKVEGVLVLRDGADVGRDLGAGGRDRRAGLLIVEPARGAEPVAFLDEAEAFLLACEGLLLELELGAVGAERKPAGGDLGDQGALGGAAGVLGGEVGLQGLFVRLRTRPKKSSS